MATILVVDDRPVNRQFLVTLLGYGGHYLLEAEDGVDALEQTRAEHPDLVISDILMPTMDGVEFARQLRANPATADIPIIFYTATYRSSETSVLAQSCGVATVLAKPSEPQVIFDAVNAVLGIESSALLQLTPLVYADAGKAQQRIVRDLRSARLSNLEELNLRIMQNMERGLKLVGDRRLHDLSSAEVSRSLTSMRAVSLRLSALIELGLELASNRDPLYLFDTSCRAAQNILNAKYAAIGVLDDDGIELRHLFVRGMASEAKAMLGNSRPGTGLLGQVLSDGRPRRAHGLHGDSRVVGLPAGHPPIDSFLAVPIAGSGRIYGWLSLADKLGATKFDADDERFAVTLAAQLASAQENLLLYDGVRRHGLSLERELAERKHVEEAALAAEEKLRNILESIDNVVWSMSATTHELLYLNPVAEQIYGRPVSNFYERKELWSDVIHPHDRERVRRIAFELLEEPSLTVEYRIVRPDGEVRWLEDRTRLVYGADGSPARLNGVASDITERKTHELRLEYLANHDELTDLPNRNLLNDRIAQSIAHARRTGQRLALLFIDLDGFKFLNDSFGNPLGDALLKAVATRLRCAVREGDTVARLSGDQFVVMLSCLTDSHDAASVVRKVLDEFARPFLTDSRELHVTASIGVSVYPDDGEVANTLLLCADAAMHLAKERSGNNFQFYTRELGVQAYKRAELEGALRVAVQNQQFELHYQPQLDLTTGQIRGAEALIRWHHPKLGLVLPSRFIPLAEETGLINPIGEWILRTACAQTQAWHEAGYRELSVAVNLSGRQFRQNLPGLVRRMLDDTGLDAQSLELELTEGTVMQNTETVIETLRDLKGIGVSLALDDFGTGYSSLSYLKHFPIDVIKIDQSFVSELVSSANDLSITKAIIAMAKSLNLTTIAEGVETQGQMALLIAHQCDQIQGYFFSRPVPAGDMQALLGEQRGLSRSH
jgi:diguanylate cyclase (GGDEF)-like protein/PAS domain S-box-containing protein